MTFSLLTYNVLYNRACCDALKMVFTTHKPDILCFQEIDTSENNLKTIEDYGYKLADYSNFFIKFGNIYGVATFYKSDKFELIESEKINLPRSFLEIVNIIWRIFRVQNQRRIVLKTIFTHKTSGKKVVVYNNHLTAWATNTVHIKQIKEALKDANREVSPLIITGDFNYFPFGRKKLEELIEKYKLEEATRNIDYTYSVESIRNPNYNILQKFFVKLTDSILRKFLPKEFKFDYIFYRNLKCVETKRINFKLSDHFPIMSTFDF